jgi:ribosome modulation factor
MVFYQCGAVPPHTTWSEQSREVATGSAHASPYQAVKKSSGWLGFISDAMEVVLKVHRKQSGKRAF